MTNEKLEIFEKLKEKSSIVRTPGGNKKFLERV